MVCGQRCTVHTEIIQLTCMAFATSPMNRSWPLRAETPQIDRRIALHQIAHHLDIAVQCDPMSWRITVLVPCTQHLESMLLHKVFDVHQFARNDDR